MPITYTNAVSVIPTSPDFVNWSGPYDLQYATDVTRKLIMTVFIEWEDEIQKGHSIAFNGVPGTLIREDFTVGVGCPSLQIAHYYWDNASLPSAAGEYTFTGQRGIYRVCTFVELKDCSTGTAKTSGQAGSGIVDSTRITHTLTGLDIGDLVISAMYNETVATVNVFGGFVEADRKIMVYNAGGQALCVKPMVSAGSFVCAHESDFYASAKAISSFAIAPTVSAFTITTVDTDNIIRVGQTGIQIVGTGLTGVTTLTMEKGAISRTLTTTGTTTATLMTFNFTEANQGGLPYGIVDLVISNGSTEYIKQITITPATGNGIVTVLNPNIEAGSVMDDATGDVPPANGDVVEWENAAQITIYANLFAEFANGVTELRLRFWDASDSTWSAWVDQTISTALTITPAIINVIAMPVTSATAGASGTITACEIQCYALELDPTVIVADGIVSPAIVNVSGLRPLEDTGFPSVNHPRLRIADTRGNDVDIFLNRNNTLEFQLLESGKAVDLSVVERMILDVGGVVIDSDSEPSRFEWLIGDGKLVIHYNGVNFPIGRVKFYLIVYTGKQRDGIVWNNPSEYYANVIDDRTTFD